jgi:hypothetical protein
MYVDNGGTFLLSLFFTGLFIFIAPIIAIWLLARWFFRILADRAFYYKMPPSERALIIKSMLFLLRHDVRSSSRVADILDFPLYTTDEALRRLIKHGYVSGMVPSVISTLQSVSLTARGNEFYADFYDSAGDVYNVAPWGVVVNKSMLIDAQVTSAATQQPATGSPQSVTLPKDTSKATSPEKSL